MQRTKMLLTRGKFRELLMNASSGKCIMPDCDKDAVDVHHIIDRKLWTGAKEKGGYFLENGAPLCEQHHRLAEIDAISPQVLRFYSGFDTIVPEGFKKDFFYNKWGEPYEIATKNGTRPVRKSDFRDENIKYPTTYYFPDSPRPPEHQSDVTSYKKLLGKPLEITFKMDGSNVKLNKDVVTARNGIDATHRSFDMLKSLHAKIKHKIPDELDVFGEWLYAKHSIHYKDELKLSDYLQIFGVYDRVSKIWMRACDVNECAAHLGLQSIGWDSYLQVDKEWELINYINTIAKNAIFKGHEGIVIRNSGAFHMCQFQDNVCKFVRDNHVQTDQHWSSQKIVKNEVWKE